LGARACTTEFILVSWNPKPTILVIQKPLAIHRILHLIQIS
jgi:hypothetical protein